MTRPGIVRADTLDLQDQDSPSTQDHSKSLAQNVDFGDNLIGSHQASEIRHIREERQDEERNLQQAWSASGESSASATNGEDRAHSVDDGKSVTDSESDAASDDDMMDRISSSPSIDDGEYYRREAETPSRLLSLQRSVARWNLFKPMPGLDISTRDDDDDANSYDYTTTDDEDVSSISTDDWPSPDTPVTNFFDRFFGKSQRQNSDSDICGLACYPTSHGLADPFVDDFTALIEDDAPPVPELPEDFTLGAPWLRFTCPHDRLHTWNPPLCTSPEEPCDNMGASASSLSISDFDMITSTSDLGIDNSRTVSTTSFRTDSELSWFPGSDEHPNSPVQALRTDFNGSWLLRDTDSCLIHVDVPNRRLQSTEDIDFDFVYALHTFVATVEGQANATKGDTMVLLDDSNSYWWLVRVVKDSSIGYLPAEHIETPTERLARLNKHRNVDLSAAMLGDNPERSKNPLKKAIKRRATKTVQFAPPTYVEASDYEYSDEEDDQVPEMRFGTNSVGGSTGNSPQQQQTATVDTIQNANGSPDNITTQTASTQASPTQSTDAPLSPKILEKDEAAALTKSRKGTARNADSFLKDDTAETRKFTLTPNLLRDDSGKSSRLSEGPSMRMETADPFAPDPKDDKRKKEKKQGMLSGLFKSKKKEKEKAKKKEFVNENEVERVSLDTARHSTASLPATDPVAKGREVMERKLSQKSRKLQKQSPGSTPVSTAPTTPIDSPAQNPLGITTSQQQPYMAELEGSQVAYEAPTGLEETIRIAPPAWKESSNAKKGKVKPAQQRQALDDFDEQEEDEARASGSLDSNDIRNGSFMHGTEAVHIPMRPSGEFDSSDGEEKGDDTGEEGKDGSSTPPSILEITEVPEGKSSPADNVVRSQSDDDKTDDDPTPVPSKPHSPHAAVDSTSFAPQSTRSLAAVADGSSMDPQRQNSKSSTGSSRANMSPSPASTNATTWSDAGLRAWLDGDNDVKDMLTIIYDTSNVKPVGPDHPLMKDLFKEEQESLSKMSIELDGLLHGFLSRKAIAPVQASG
ncbi:Tip elongation aberrant protein Tea4 [Sphaceloma murrayae]|uniref:Tip elongation aberrant protein Tea4 n=1 Tax=Sphaceloma murrayae TaxID=2082308 RepID=A0A2K1QW45_9PEZI|nr:Tip elongation aberrant protein Tea4 [Sphaceloma murrayae]